MTDFHWLGMPGYEPTPENDHNRQIPLPSSVENSRSEVQRMCKAILVSKSTLRHHKSFNFATQSKTYLLLLITTTRRTQRPNVSKYAKSVSNGFLLALEACLVNLGLLWKS